MVEKDCCSAKVMMVDEQSGSPHSTHTECFPVSPA
jgi:hypothetical protein